MYTPGGNKKYTTFVTWDAICVQSSKLEIEPVVQFCFRNRVYKSATCYFGIKIKNE